MSDKIEQLREELVSRIESHRVENPFTPTIDYKTNEVKGETIVNYYVDLPKGERGIYSRDFFDSDRNWVEARGVDLDLTASLYCKWQT